MITRAATTTSGLEVLAPGLVASVPEPLPFGRDLAIRAFLLERGHGNILVYGTGAVAGAREALAERGGVSWQYLGHWHEAMFGVDRAAEALGAPVVVHEADREEVVHHAGLEPATFSRRSALGEGFEIVPIPGHTPGATAYLAEHGEHRYLFTGDSLYIAGGEWIAAVLASSDRERYLESLELIRELDFDVLVPWAATAGEPPYAHTGPADIRRRLDAVIRRVRWGDDH